MELKNIFFRILIAIISFGAINAQNSRNEIQDLNYSGLETIDSFSEGQKQIITKELREPYPFKNLLSLQKNTDWTLSFKSLDISFIDKKLEEFRAFMKTRITIDVLNTNKQIIFNTNTESKVNLTGIDYLTSGIINDTTMLNVLPEFFFKTTLNKSTSTGIWNPYTSPKISKNPKTFSNLNSSLIGQGYSIKNVLKIWGGN